ncbi:glycosyltransferase 8 domain-containing protein 1 [Anabrus simplex]|uniref:glycosyltransferase 8 domain-containing protein 1 n=1 Tax=Anabrus simplex TaxID=316456 RepID=UPI0035A36A4F
MNTSLRIKFGGLLALVICWCVFMVYLVSYLEWMPPLPLLQQFQNSGPSDYHMQESKPLLLPKLAKNDIFPETFHQEYLKHKILTTTIKSLAAATPLSPVVRVIVTGDSLTIGGLVALINSILSNTKSHVKFYIVITEEELPHLKTWIHSTKLHTMDYEIHTVPLSGNKAAAHLRKVKMEMNLYFPNLEGKVIYMDNDIIVQGDIMELYAVKIQPNTYGAFAQDCSSSSARAGGAMGRPRYASHINLHHSHILDLDIDGSACPFATGVFVANISEWKEKDVFERLQGWVDAHKEGPITGLNPGVDEIEAAMLIEFYGKITALDPLWHIQHLGLGSTSRHSKQFIERAKLLHWSGHFKPWRHWSAHSEHWDRYFVPDPTLQFRPIRKRS